MKTKKLLLVLLAPTMTVVSCNNNSTDENEAQTVKYESVDAAGNTYILVITGNTSRAAYAGAAGDSYVLTIKQQGQTTDKESKGAVSTIKADGELTMKPTKADDTFDVKINNGGKMTAINGTITLEDGTKVPAPGAVKPIDGIFTSIADMAAWLSARPGNTADTPYTVKLNVSDLAGIVSTLKANNTKYISLDLSGSTFISVGDSVFSGCANLANITIPNSVTSIGNRAFESCSSLTSVRFEGMIPPSGFYNSTYAPVFDGDLRDKYFAANGGIGTYTRARGSSRWTKQ